MTKEAKRDYDRRRYLADAERIKARSRQYHASNRQRELAGMQDYYYMNRDERLDAARAYQQKKKLGENFRETNQPETTIKITIIEGITEADVLSGGSAVLVWMQMDAVGGYKRRLAKLS